MIESRKHHTNIGVAVGLALEVGGRILMAKGSSYGAAVNPAADLLGLAGAALVLAGVAFFVWGCMSYTLGKGYSRWWGLLGLASVFGLFVLVLMRDRRPYGMAPDGWPTDRSHLAARSSAGPGPWGP